MSNEKNESTVLALAQKVLNLLNIGEEAKITNFYGREIKKFETCIRDHKRNLTTLENAYKDAVDDINYKIEDAQQAVEDAKVNITINNVRTNEDSEKFSHVYWRNIDVKLAYIEELKSNLVKLKEHYDYQVKDTNEKIEKCQARINMIKKG